MQDYTNGLISATTDQEIIGEGFPTDEYVSGNQEGKSFPRMNTDGHR